MLLEMKEHLGEDGKVEKDAIESKIATMKKREGYRQVRADLMHALQRVMRAGQRKTMLTSAEEGLRLKLTWQDFDYTQDLLAFCRESLKKCVTDVEY